MLTLGCVTRLDPEAAVVPKLAIKFHSYLAEAGEPRIIPPLKDDVPRLDCIKAVGDKVKAVPIPAFMVAPKGTASEKIWAKAKPGEKAIFYIVGGGYQTGHPLMFYVTWELANQSGLRVFCKYGAHLHVLTSTAPNYRKCLTDDTAWPAPLLDCLSGWQYLVEELGFEPKVSHVLAARH
jgi:acetyl esterase/lipase